VKANREGLDQKIKEFHTIKKAVTKVADEIKTIETCAVIKKSLPRDPSVETVGFPRFFKTHGGMFGSKMNSVQKKWGELINSWENLKTNLEARIGSGFDAAKDLVELQLRNKNVKPVPAERLVILRKDLIQSLPEGLFKKHKTTPEKEVLQLKEDLNRMVPILKNVHEELQSLMNQFRTRRRRMLGEHGRYDESKEKLDAILAFINRFNFKIIIELEVLIQRIKDEFDQVELWHKKYSELLTDCEDEFDKADKHFKKKRMEHKKEWETKWKQFPNRQKVKFES